MMFRTTLIASLLCANAYGAGDFTGWINRGERIGWFDPIASVTVALLDSKKEMVCTGSIIASDLVLTAAHCLGDLEYVGFGIDLDEKDAVRTITGAIGHSLYPSRKDEVYNTYDIALVSFKGGLPDGYWPIKIAPSWFRLYSNRTVMIAGYGRDSGKYDDLLKIAYVKRGSFKVGDLELPLDYQNGKGTCYGDSGGPAIVRYWGELLLVGVNNRVTVDEEEECISEMVFAKPHAFWSWMQTTAQKLR